MSIDEWIQKEGWYVECAGEWMLTADDIKDKLKEAKDESDLLKSQVASVSKLKEKSGVKDDKSK